VSGGNFDGWMVRAAIGAWLSCMPVIPVGWRLTLYLEGVTGTPGKYAVALLWVPLMAVPLFCLSIGYCLVSCSWAGRRARVAGARAARAGRLATLLFVGWWVLKAVPILRLSALVLAPISAASLVFPGKVGVFYAVAALQVAAGLALQGFLTGARAPESA
jgi:hypothetical protein